MILNTDRRQDERAGGETAPKPTIDMSSKKEQDASTNRHFLESLIVHDTQAPQINGLFDDIINELTRIADSDNSQADSVATGYKRKREVDGDQEDEPVTKWLKTEE
jgi:hypothetical protein